ncbi:NAD kinase domain containing protein [Trichuris trichiura]|uniref:NAD(+) kinase n=1 Tax=Trichuris trichiura TaxID=36087 RepID=A0A077ZH53_TRITR|nr:NAD kinase domain containing protein [Trichuris trichiura]
MNSSREHVSDIDSKPYFNPSRVLVLSKITRLDFERRRLQKRDDEDSHGVIRDGADCSKLWKQHNAHYSYLKRICQELSARNIEYKVVQRWDYNPEAIDWCDAVISAGGDGTYLLAASKIREQSKPLIGINTDPTRSGSFAIVVPLLMRVRVNFHVALCCREEKQQPFSQPAARLSRCPVIKIETGFPKQDMLLSTAVLI